MHPRSVFTCLPALLALIVSVTTPLPGNNWLGIQGSVDGGTGDQTWNAAVVQPDGTFVLAGARQEPTTLPSLMVHELSPSAYGGGSVIRIEPSTGLILSLTQVPGVIVDMDMTPEGDLLLASRSGSMAISAAGDALLWRAGSSDEIVSDGQGGAWFSTRKGKQVTHVDKTGKTLRSFKAGAGFGIHALTYLPEQELVLVAGGISRPGPIHVPYIHAHKHDGSMAWKMFDFPGMASVKIGDIADTIVQKMLVGPDGTLYAVAHSDGGATMWRHHPQKMGQKMKNVPIGHQGNQMYLAKRSNRIICLAKINPENGMTKKIAYVTSWAHTLNKPDDKVASDQKAIDMAISPSGKLALAGVAYGNIPWTENAVHKSNFPIDIVGRYNNPVSVGEPYVIILDADLEKSEIFTGLGQSKDFPGEARAVALTDDAIIVGGYIKTTPGTPVSHVAWNKGGWSSQTGGGQDALLAFFGKQDRKIDSLPSDKLSTYSKVALPSGERIPRDMNEALQNPESIAARLITMVADQGIRQANALVDAGDLAGGEAIWNDLIRKFVGTPWAEQAAQAQETLKSDPNYNKRKSLAREIATYQKTVERLRDVKDAKASALDFNYYNTNRSSLGKLQNIAEDMVELDESAAKAIVADAKRLGLPLTKTEENAFKNYHQALALGSRLKPRGKEKASWQDKSFRKRNQRSLLQIKALLDQIATTNADHPVTAAAAQLATSYGFEQPATKDSKKKKK